MKLIEETENCISDFDGCCYGLREQFSHPPKYIKNPWRIVSWGVDFGESLPKRCDGRHEHAPCAGRETVGTQVYTSNIVSTILKRLNEDLDQDRVILSKDESRRTGGTKSKATCVVLLSAIRSPDLSLDPNSCSKTPSDCDFQLHLSIDPLHLCLHSFVLPCDRWSSERSGFNSPGSTEHDNKMATTSAETPNVLPIIQGSGGGNVDLLMSRVEGGSIARFLH